MKINYLLLIVCLGINELLLAQTTDAAGKKQGYWKKKDEKTNKLIYEGLFKDDKPQGLFKYYNFNDSIKAKMIFVQDGKFAYSTLYHLNGKKMAIGKYIGEKKDSIWCYFDESGLKISQENYIQGKKNGTEYVYFPDGAVSEERNYKNGIMNGPFKLYFDKVHLKGEGSYLNGLMEGKNAYYYPNGVYAAVGNYKNGYKIGPWIYNEANGKVKEKELFKPNGKLASKKETEEFFSKNKSSEEKPTGLKKEVKSKETKPKGSK